MVNVPSPTPDRATVARVSLDEPLAPIELAPGHEQALIIATARGFVIGEVLVPGASPIAPEAQRSALGRELGDRLWRSSLTHALRDTTRRSGGSPAERPAPSVSVVVCTRHRPDDLDRCLTSIAALRTPPKEVVVVDNSSGDAETAKVCGRHGVRVAVEEVPGLSRARNRGIAETSGDIVAFVDDDCVVDPAWTESPMPDFADPLVMVVAGYVGPLELDTPAQYAFEQLGGFARAFDAVVLDGRTIRWPGIGDGNSFFRRTVFDEIGGFAEDLGPGTPALSGQDADIFARIFTAGYRMALDPQAVVWHGHRADHSRLRTAIFGYSVGFAAFAARSLFGRRDPRALRYGAWWLQHLGGQTLRGLRRPSERVPADLVLAGVAGVFMGPWRLLKSKLRRSRHRPLLESTTQNSPPVTRVTGDPPPAMSLTIASRNRRPLLVETLQALDRQTYPSERLEVVVVLDGTTDDSAEALRGMSTGFELRVLEQENRGLAASRNRGLRETTNQVVIFLDDDILPTPGLVAAHADSHAGENEGHVAVGYYPPATDDRGYWALEVRAWWEDYFRRRAQPDHEWTFVDMSDGNTSAPRELLLEAGGWDEDFTGGRRQDWEFGARLLKQGVRLRDCAAAEGGHRLDTSFATAFWNASHEGQWDVVLARKHPELKGRLPFSQFGRAHGGEMSRRGRFAYTRPGAAGALSRAALPVLRTLEALNLQRQWRELSWLVLAREYVQGVARELPTIDELQAFVADADDAVVTVPLVIGGPRPDVGAGIAPVNLDARCGEVAIASTRAPLPSEQWDWDSVVERLVAGSQFPPPPEILRCVADQLPPGTREVLTAWGESLTEAAA
jgi:glycosyltransferase involved in cell wall biosynthesis